MTILVDSTLVTSLIALPIREHWLSTDGEFDVRDGLHAEDISPGDVALISIAEATRLTKTHLIEPTVAVILDGVSPIAMRTPVRPDGIEDTVVRLLDVGPTAELAMRALLKPYFGIVATLFVTGYDAAEAQVIVLDGMPGMGEPEAGHQEDLAKAWFVLTGTALVSHVTVVGVEAEARGAGAQIAQLAEAAAVGVQRRRDVRRLLTRDSEDAEIDRDWLVEITNRMRFSMTSEDRQSAANLVAQGGWGGRFGRNLPVYRDQIASADGEPSDNAGATVMGDG